VRLLRQVEFWAALSITIATILLMVAINLRYINLGYFVGPFRLSHWFVWIGALYIAFAVPIIAIAKLRNPEKYVTLLKVHVFVNLLAFLLISLHFAGQISRPAQANPMLGTGLALYIDMSLLVATGFVHRFQILPQARSKTRKFVHVGLAFPFYIIIVIHILHGVGVI
jgi:hypothetical protein